MKLLAGLKQRPWGRSAPVVFCVCPNAEESREEKRVLRGGGKSNFMWGLWKDLPGSSQIIRHCYLL